MAEPDGATPLRVVLDTNIVLSALLFRTGALSPLRHHWQRGEVLPLVSKPVTQELLRVLAYPKFKLTATEQHAMLADYLPWAEVVPATTSSGALDPLPRCRDPHDQMFLELAYAGRADWLVTGDQDLLALASHAGHPFSLRIGTAAALIDQLAALRA